jgi:hypothetical protein
MMKIALIKKNPRETASLQIIIQLQQKKPIESKTLELVPIFNGR